MNHDRKLLPVNNVNELFKEGVINFTLQALEVESLLRDICYHMQIFHLTSSPSIHGDNYINGELLQKVSLILMKMCSRVNK